MSTKDDSLTPDGLLAVVILTLNEEMHIARCISALARSGLNHHIYVIDSGSTDRTVEIAESAGAVVLHHPFENYSRQFSWALEAVPRSLPWVLRLDADELIPQDLGLEIIRAIQTARGDVNGFILNRQHIFWDRQIRFGGRYPLRLLRVWRNGAAKIEQRWMDEHMVLTSGSTRTLRHRFFDANLRDLTYFTSKHNGYATREAIDVILAAWTSPRDLHTLTTQARIKRLLKLRVYNRIPFPVAATAYFIQRYIFQLGFLDGLPGLVYHGLQGGWYRFLVGAKVKELSMLTATATTEAEARQILRSATGYAV